ncbi:hypothetical protein Clacol_000032, partial [Clathrus columnatus]
LRRRNIDKSTPHLSDIHLPTLSLSRNDPAQTQRSVLRHLHESLGVEMAERSDPVIIGDTNTAEPDVDYVRGHGDFDNLDDNMNSGGAM